MPFPWLNFRQNQYKLVSDICISGEAPSGMWDRMKVSMEKRETSDGCVGTCSNILLYRSSAQLYWQWVSPFQESDENARNATYINNEERLRSRGTCHTAGWESCSASVRIQTPAAVLSSLHSFVKVTAVDTVRMEWSLAGYCSNKDWPAGVSI